MTAKPVTSVAHRFPLLIAVGVVLSIAAASFVFSFTNSDAERRWEAHGQDQLFLFERQVDRALGWLDATAGLFHASNFVDAFEFNAFVSSLNIDGRVGSIAWAPKIERNERQSFVDRRREDGAPDFRIIERDARGNAVPRRPNHVYFPIAYLYSNNGGETILGIDLLSQSAHETAVIAATARGTAVSSSRVNLATADRPVHGTRVLVPVSKQTGTAASERTGDSGDLLGFIVGTFNIDRLVASMPNDPVQGTRFEILELSGDDGQRRLFPADGADEFDGTVTNVVSRDITVADRIWRVYAIGSTTGFSLMRYLPAALTLLFGLALTKLVDFQSRLARRRQWETEAQKARNRELKVAHEETDHQRLLQEAAAWKLEGANRKIMEQNEKLTELSSKLSRYLSPELYEKIFSGSELADLSSERKELTILFADVVGFSEMAERLEPDDLSTVLNTFLTSMSAIAALHGGSIDKFMGDGMLVVFGDHTSSGVEADAIACLRMAMEMVETVRDLTMGLNNGSHEPLECHIGISTGMCSVGNFGSPDRLDYTVVSANVNLASRLEKLAGPGDILVSQRTYENARDAFVFEEADTIDVRGFSESVRYWKLLRAIERSETHAKDALTIGSQTAA